MIRKSGSILLASFIALILSETAFAINFSSGYSVYWLSNTDSPEKRVIIDNYGYVKEATGDFQLSARKAADGSRIGDVIYGKWKIDKKYECYDDDGHGGSVKLPRCDQDVIAKAAEQPLLAWSDVGLISLVVQFVLPFLVWQLIAGVLILPFSFFVFYPVGSVLYRMGVRKYSMSVLTALISPVLYLAVRIGIPDYSSYVGNPFGFMFVAVIWFYLAFFGVVWFGTEKVLGYFKRKYENGEPPFKRKYDIAIEIWRHVLLFIATTVLSGIGVIVFEIPHPWDCATLYSVWGLFSIIAVSRLVHKRRIGKNGV